MTNQTPRALPLIEHWLDAAWMEKGLSDNTLASYRRDLVQFIGWLEQRAGLSPEACERHHLEGYLGDRATFNARTVSRQLSALRGFYRWLKREGRIAVDPTLLVEPK